MSSVSGTHALACLGGPPAFAEPIPVGQLYFPSWERYEAAMGGILERGWYTNHGPQAQELERRLEAFFGVRNVVAVSNATVGLLMALRCLGVEGDVIVPGFTFVASAQAVLWAGLGVRFCDVDPDTHQVTPETLADALDENVSAILAVNLWGGSCDPERVERFAADHGLSLLFDSAHGVGVETSHGRFGHYGHGEIFSFHATKILSATEGGCVCTDDDDLAAKLRNMRSSYGAGPPMAVPLTSNGRFSEAQAAIALMSLDDFDRNRAHNEAIHARYAEGLAFTRGVRLVTPANVARSNYQYVVVDLDESEAGISRDQLLAALRAENVVARRYFQPGVHRTPPFAQAQPNVRLPATERLCERLLQLPVGALVTEEAATAIADLVGRICEQAATVSAALAPVS